MRSLILTKHDHAENYAGETLFDGLQQNLSFRHLSRLAHIYFATHERLTLQDWQDNIPRLLQRVYGQLPLDGQDWGWLGKVAGLTGFPKHGLLEEIVRDLEGTFEVDDGRRMRWSREQSGAFRVYQLVSATEKGNLFDVCVCSGGGGFKYPFPIKELPAQSQIILDKWVKNPEMIKLVPKLYVQLSGFNSRLEPPIVDNHIALDICDFFIMRFILWFCAAGARKSANTTGPKATVLSTIAQLQFSIRDLNLAQCSIMDVCYGQPANEILLSWCRFFLPHDATQPPPCSPTFRNAIAELWLTYGPTETVSSRVLHALLIVMSHLQSDPKLKSDALATPLEAQLRKSHLTAGLTAPLAELRKPLYHFFITCITNFPSERFSTLLALYCAVLQPWKASWRIGSSVGGTLSSPAAATKKRTFAVSPTGVVTGSLKSDPPPGFSAEWTWFVIQHYSLYVDGLLEIFRRISNETNTEKDVLKMVKGLFEYGPFASDGVIATLLACHAVMNGNDEIGGAYQQDAAAQRAIEIVRGQADGVREALTLESQFLKNGMALSNLFSPDAKENAGNVLKQLWYQHKEYVKNTNMLERALFTSGSDSNVGMERLRTLFKLPEAKELMVRRTKDTQEMTWPSMEPVVGLPRWLKVKSAAEFSYNKLTHLGVQQIKTGKKIGNPELAAQYLGDALENPPPPFSYEIPALVWALLVLSRWLNSSTTRWRVNLRFLADARNLIFALVLPLAVVDLMMMNGKMGIARSSLLIVMMLMGCTTLRGVALGLWLAVGVLIEWFVLMD